MEKLAESTSLDELVNRLKGTLYSDAVARVAAPYTARAIELALREHLVTTHYGLMVSASKYRLLQMYYLKHVAWDLKSALKSRALGRSYEETMEFIDIKAEELVGRRDLIAKIVSAKDVEEAVSLLSGTEFSKDVEKALSSYLTKKEVRFFDVYIDHAVLTQIAKEYSANESLYSSSRAAGVAGVWDLVASDIDAYNTLSALRAKLWGIPEQEARDLVITPTFRVPVQSLSRMTAAETISEAVRLLEGTYNVTAGAAPGDEQLIDTVEEMFTEETRKTAAKAFYWQGLGVADALALVKLLEFEVSNLAAVAIGIEARIQPTDIISKLRM